MLANGDWKAEPYSDPGLANNRSCYVLFVLHFPVVRLILLYLECDVHIWNSHVLMPVHLFVLHFAVFGVKLFSSWSSIQLPSSTTRKAPASDIGSGPPAKVRAGKCTAKWFESGNTQAELSKWEEASGNVSHDVLLLRDETVRLFSTLQNISATFSRTHIYVLREDSHVLHLWNYTFAMRTCFQSTLLQSSVPHCSLGSSR